MNGKIFLKDEIMEDEDFEAKKQEKGTEKWTQYFLQGVRLFRDDGRFYLLLHALENKVPKMVRDVIDGISFYKRIPADPERTRGKYISESASATLDWTPGEKGNSYAIQITSKTMEDARKLYYAIRAGEILPTESWEEKQVEPMSEMRVKFNRGAAGYKPFIEVTFPDWQVLTFRSGSMKDNFHKITTPERNKAIALCEQAIIEMGKGNCPQVYRDLYHELCHGKRRQ